ncbi:MAG TPA: sigma-70 family RNA polymerase sigma factor [Planctomycetota bacterium]
MHQVPIENLLIHADFVRGLVRDLVRDPHECEDLEQEAWLQALRRPPGHAVSLRGWLTALVGSLWANRTRDAQRRRVRELAAAAPPPDADRAESIAAREQVRQRLLAAVLRLPEPFRAAVLLRYYDELSPTQIAARLGVPAATVRTRVARGLERLRAELDAEHGGERAAWALPLLAFPAPAPLASLPLSTLLAMKKSFVVAAALLLAAVSALAWFVWFAPPMPTPEDPLPRVAAVAPAARVPAAASPALAAGARVAPPAAESDARCALEVIALWKSDKQPASSQAIDLTYPTDVDAELSPRRLVTDEIGRVVFEQLPPGNASVQASTGVRQQVVLTAADRTAVTLLLDGIPVRGLVVDSRDQPVPDADVWVSSEIRYATAASDERPAHGQYGHFTLRTDAAGCFATRLFAKQCLAAFKVGHGPSATVYPVSGMAIAPAEPVSCTLRLQSAGAALTVRVVDESATPVRGAVVLVGQEVPTITEDIRTATTPALRATTNEDGLAQFAVLSAGKLPLQIRAPGLAPSRQEVEIPVGATTSIDVVLTAGATVRGFVLDGLGVPLPRACVRCGDGVSLQNVWTAADESGAYRLANLPPGDIEVQALHPAWGRVRTRVNAANGGVVDWDAHMPPRATIAGLVLDAAGQPARGADVIAYAGRDERGAHAKADAAGNFCVLPLDPGCVYHLRAEVPLADGGIAVATMSGVLAGSVVELRPRAEAAPTARIRGRVVKPDGKPAVGYSVTAMPEHEPIGCQTTVGTDGTFEMGPWQPMSVQLAVNAPGGTEPLAEFAVFTLRRGETLDVGELVVPVPGSALVRISPRGQARMWAALFRDGRSVRNRMTTADQVSWDDLQPGAYSLCVTAFGSAPATGVCNFEVVSGVQAVRDLVLQAATRRRLRIAKPATGPAVLMAQATSAAGHTFLKELWLEPESDTCQVLLPSDAVVVRLTARGGYHGEVSGNALAADPIDVKLTRVK